MKIDSYPPGATIYLNSRACSPLGVTTWEGKLNAGEYTVIFEAAGYDTNTWPKFRVTGKRDDDQLFATLVKKTDPPPASVVDGAAEPSDLPDGLDRAMISDGVSKVKERVLACGDNSSAKGQVKVRVAVGPDGSVASVTVLNTPDPALGNCVAGVMQQAKFAKTQTGGSFAYPFQF